MMDMHEYYQLSYEMQNSQSEEEDNFIRQHWGLDRKIAERKKLREDELQQELDALILDEGVML